MPTVIADNRVLYSGPSPEDAELVMEIARELGVFRKSLRFKPEGGSTPSGLCGRALLEVDSRAQKAIITEALSHFRERQERLGLRKQGWSGEPSADPPKRVIQNLIAASASEDFETARRQWEYRGEMVYEGDTGFQAECDLCGPKERMRANYIIHNIKNGRKLSVGSVCVKRFLVLAGTSSQAESVQLFDHKTALATFGQTQKGYIADLGLDVIPEKLIIGLMGALEKAFPQGLSLDDAQIIVSASGVNERAGEVFKALATKDAAVLRRLKVKKMRNTNVKERRRKLRSVLTTLSRSGAYRDPGR